MWTKTCPRFKMHTRVVFARLRHAHCRTIFLEEESRRIWWKPRLHIFWGATCSNVPSNCVFFPQITKYACNQHVLQQEMQSATRIVATVSIIGSANESAHIKLHYAQSSWISLNLLKNIVTKKYSLMCWPLHSSNQQCQRHLIISAQKGGTWKCALASSSNKDHIHGCFISNAS